MFYEVRILNPRGKLKKVVPSKALDRLYWERFFNKGWSDTFLIKSRGRNNKLKALLGPEYDAPDFSDE